MVDTWKLSCVSLPAGGGAAYQNKMKPLCLDGKQIWVVIASSTDDAYICFNSSPKNDKNVARKDWGVYGGAAMYFLIWAAQPMRGLSL